MQNATNWYKWLNRGTRWLMLALVLLVWPHPAAAQVEPDAAQTPVWLLNQPANMPVPPFVPGQVLVAVHGDAAHAAGAWDGLGVAAVESMELSGLIVEGEAATLLRLHVPAGDEWAAVEQLQADPAVRFAELDWYVHTAQDDPLAPLSAEPAIRFGDPLYPAQWYLPRLGFARAWGIVHTELGAPLTPITVAVVDTGVDFQHPALAGRLLIGRNYLTVGAAPNDDNGHGTHVTGVIAATLGRNGMAGIAPNVRINPLKVLDANGIGSVSAVAQAIRDAADGGAHVINLSLQLDVDSALLRSAIDYAAARGALIIAAAGNCTSAVACPITVRYPARYANVLAVAASTYGDTRASFSAVGPELDLAAPGGGGGSSILSTWPAGALARCRNGLQQVGGGAYCLADGTSMAAGIASGVAALIWGMRPELDADGVRDLLKETTAPIGPLVEVGQGRLDAAQAARRALPPRLIVTPGSLFVTARPGDDVLTASLHLTNPSLEPLTWEIVPADASEWYTATGMLGGTVRFGSTVMATAWVSPTELAAGAYLGAFNLRATRDGENFTETTVPLQLNIVENALDRHLHLPFTARSYTPSQWFMPDTAGARRLHVLSNSSSVTASLPFTLTSHGQNFTALRIHADGLVTLPETTLTLSAASRCLANRTAPPLAVYGWWADLDPSLGGQVSSFPSGNDRFVVEYAQVRSAAGVFPVTTVSFQIVLRQNGAITLNYRQVPDDGAARTVTIGATAGDGRFYNQIACSTPSVQLGRLPFTGQTIILRPEDLY